MVKPDPNGREYYMSPNLVRALDKIKNRIQKKDQDMVMVIDGSEGAGKSSLMMQICKYMDPSFNINDVCMNGDEFGNAITSAIQFKALSFDEGGQGLNSRASLTAASRILVSKMMEMRQKNLFVVICIPSIFFLDRYVSMFRAKCLLHVYVSHGRRGYWIGFNEKNKKKLLLEGRKEMSYRIPYIKHFRGRFYGKYVLDNSEDYGEAVYRAKKMAALEKSGTDERPLGVREARWQEQRDKLIWLLIDVHKYHYRPLAELLKSRGITITTRNMWQIVRKERDDVKCS